VPRFLRERRTADLEHGIIVTARCSLCQETMFAAQHRHSSSASLTRNDGTASQTPRCWTRCRRLRICGNLPRRIFAS